MTIAATRVLLARHWVHSHEEDEPGVQVYRPIEHRLPPARGRDSLELHVDGSANLYRPGQADVASSRPAAWELSKNGVLSLDLAGGTDSVRFHVLDVQADVLKLRDDR